MREKNSGQLSEQVVSSGLSALVDYAIGIYPCTCDTFLQTRVRDDLVRRHCLNCHADSYFFDHGIPWGTETFVRTHAGACLKLFSLDDVSRAVAFGVVPTKQESEDPVETLR